MYTVILRDVLLIANVYGAQTVFQVPHRGFIQTFAVNPQVSFQKKMFPREKTKVKDLVNLSKS